MVEKSKSQIKCEFRKLCRIWRKTRPLFSSRVQDIVNNPAYEAIIQLGDAVVPLILKDIEKDLGSEKGPDFWEIALHRITGVDLEIPEEFYGQRRIIAQYWLRWGEKEGLILATMYRGPFEKKEKK